SIETFNESEEGQELLEKVEKYDLQFLSMWPGTLFQMTNNKRPIKTPEDMKGLKFRVMSGGLIADQFTYLDAGATSIPFSDLYISLQQGVVDGQENPFQETFSTNLHEVQDYLTVTNHKMSTYPLLTNKKFWGELPDDIR